MRRVTIWKKNIDSDLLILFVSGLLEKNVKSKPLRASCAPFYVRACAALTWGSKLTQDSRIGSPGNESTKHATTLDQALPDESLTRLTSAESWATCTPSMLNVWLPLPVFVFRVKTTLC